MANIIYATTQNSIKKQLNDIYLSFSFDVHKEFYTLSVQRITVSGSTTLASGSQLLFTEIVGDKLWEKKRNANSLGHNGIDPAGEAILFVARNPVGKNNIDVTIPFTTVTGTGNVLVRTEAYAGKNQATFLANGGLGSTDIIPDITILGDGTASGGITVTGATAGDNFKLMSMPTLWNLQNFVRTITPNLPKDYTEVADHFDGSADTIRITTIKNITLGKVFEDIPGSFLMLTDRTVTIKGEMKELDRSVASETYFYTGCRGTGKVTFNRDGESITEAEMTMVDWITVTG